MIRAIVIKEVREQGWVALAALALGWFTVYQLCTSSDYGYWANAADEVPVVRVGIGAFGFFIGWLAAALLGLRQATLEDARGTYLFLLHRPCSRRRVFLTKLAVGAAMLLVAVAIPILEYAWWAATPGHIPAPFDWSMTASSWFCWAATPVVYVAAFASGLRPARWHGTRLLPLAATLMILGSLLVMFHTSAAHMLLFFGAILALGAALVYVVLDSASSRDYS